MQREPHDGAGSTALRDALPLRQRLALSYARGQDRGALLALLSLDARIASILRAAREPMLAQIKLAWWRSTLESDAAQWPEGEPLLAALRSWPGDRTPLIDLVHAWEGMIAPAPLAVGVFDELANARGGAFAALAGEVAFHHAHRMGRAWALADIALRLSDAMERENVLALAKEQDWQPARLPHPLRPLSVLHRLARAELREATGGHKTGARDLLAAMRLGWLGI
ncbi:MAG: hypothetical protein WCY11_17505 [Novosphingobium sp.]